METGFKVWVLRVQSTADKTVPVNSVTDCWEKGIGFYQGLLVTTQTPEVLEEASTREVHI